MLIFRAKLRERRQGAGEGGGMGAHRFSFPSAPMSSGLWGHTGSHGELRMLSTPAATGRDRSQLHLAIPKCR